MLVRESRGDGLRFNRRVARRGNQSHVQRGAEQPRDPPTLLQVGDDPLLHLNVTATNSLRARKRYPLPADGDVGLTRPVEVKATG
jgi:hypothetical protein